MKMSHLSQEHLVQLGAKFCFSGGRQIFMLLVFQLLAAALRMQPGTGLLAVPSAFICVINHRSLTTEHMK